MTNELRDYPIQRALISVSDKTGIVELARHLANARIEIYSTGGTARHLAAAGIPVREVADYTEFPEMLDGRVKTLHPKIFAGILSRLDHVEDQNALRQFGILAFGLVVVNLYPFAETIARPQCTLSEAIEQIDIGGPSLIRAAAKNHQYVTVLTDPTQYDECAAAIEADGGTTLAMRRRYMAAAFSHTAKYDQTVAAHFTRQWPSPVDQDEVATNSHQAIFPESLQLSFRRKEVLRYGENSHQRGALYADPEYRGGSLVNAVQHHGKQLSYNNLLDLDAAWQCVRNQVRPACAVIKHNNPCGAAVAATLSDACQRAFAGDPLSAFGGVIAMNRAVDIETATWLCNERELFVEAIVAIGFDSEALRWLIENAKWRTNVRLLSIGDGHSQQVSMDYRSIAGGLLVQESDTVYDPAGDWVPAVGDVDPATAADLQFAWDICRIVKSNAIVVVRDGMVVGVGAGQMSRVDSVKIALEKAGHRAQGGALASDAFFPFADSIEIAAAAKIRAIVQPGGAKRDAEVIDAAGRAGIAMLLTGKRHFRH